MVELMHIAQVQKYHKLGHDPFGIGKAIFS
jgi:hypothetical protein